MNIQMTADTRVHGLALRGAAVETRRHIKATCGETPIMAIPTERINAGLPA
jgi:hypothetical protein